MTKLWTFEICHFSRLGHPEMSSISRLFIIPPFAGAGFDPKIMIFQLNHRTAVKFASPPVSTSLFGSAVMAKVGHLWFWSTLLLFYQEKWYFACFIFARESTKMRFLVWLGLRPRRPLAGQKNRRKLIHVL